MNHEDIKAQSRKARRMVFAAGIFLLAGVLVWLAAIPRGKPK